MPLPRSELLWMSMICAIHSSIVTGRALRLAFNSPILLQGARSNHAKSYHCSASCCISVAAGTCTVESGAETRRSSLMLSGSEDDGEDARFANSGSKAIATIILPFRGTQRKHYGIKVDNCLGKNRSVTNVQWMR
ncbi:hypothetical protein EDC04DRAFT_2089217 [Pisolithus marmoratus]|nr:hypothetical protein EDC04DRAFT_2089217 [Pisolithus marmoratus]